MLRELRFNVGGDPSDDIPTLYPDLPPNTPGIVCTFEQPGRLLAIIPSAVYGGATLIYQCGSKSFRVIVPPNKEGQWEAGDPLCLPPEYGGDPDKVALHYTPDADLPILEPRGRYFWQDGERFFLNGATAFGAIAVLYEQGEAAVRARFKQRQDLGFNSARLWTAINNPTIMRMIPREHPDFYEVVVTLSHLAAEYEQYPYWTVYAGASAETLGDQGAMIEHQHRMEQALAPLGFSLLDLHNEEDNSFNAASKFISPNPPGSLVWSQGSNNQDVDPPQPYGRFVARHPGSAEWQRKTGKQLWDFQQNSGLQLPGVDDETVRCEPGGETNRRHAFDAARCGALFVAGAFYHSAQAKRFELFSGSELDLAAGWCEGVRWVTERGLDVAQEGSYSRPEDPNFLRVYVKTLGGRQTRVEVAV